MNTIKKLSESLISKIAAGEVVERPAYAVKELIENSIDAKSNKIIVVLKDYGLSEIKVIDNGIGIKKAELELAIQPHTTSKINTEADLEKIKSMGFRGEALSSITTISDYEIKSNGYVINTKSNTPSKTAMPDGSQIIIKNIFSKTPARKKYLASKQTEYRHILNQFQSIALAYPKISFELTHNSKQIYNLKSEDINSRIKNVLGEELVDNSFDIKLDDNYLKISGLISHPQINFKSKNKIYIFVNNRRIYNTNLINALTIAYRNLLMSNTYPFAIINIQIQEDLVDVNVHPRKELVKFIDEKQILQSIKEVVGNTLDNNNLTFSNISFAKKLTKTQLANSLRDEVMQTNEGQIGKVKRSADIIQLHNLYLITETENGILILDQHAVHEAILYYKFRLAYKKRKSKQIKNKLKKPLLIQLSESQISLVEEHKNYLNKIGFEIEEFGHDKFKLSSVPVVATDLDPRVNFLETLQDLENNNLSDIEEHTNSMLSYLSCRSAIKAGEKLTKKQMRELIKYLDKIDLGYTCPHGRPVKIELSKAYLDTMFRRS